MYNNFSEDEAANRESLDENVQVSLNHVKQALSEVLMQLQEKEDDINIFCKNIEKVLRKMSLGDLAISKLKIQKILFDYEMSQHKFRKSAVQTESPEVPASSQASSSKHANRETTAFTSTSGPESASRSDLFTSPSTSQVNTSKALNLAKPTGAIFSPTDPSDSNSNENRSCQENTPDRIIFGPKLKDKESETSLESNQFNTKKLPCSESSGSLTGNEMQLVSTAVSSSTIGESSGMDSPSSSHSTNAVQVKWSSHSADKNQKCDLDTLKKTKSSESHPTISVSSLHQKRHFDLDSPSVLRYSLSHDPATLKNSQPQPVDGVPDSSKEISPEQLKVLAKNLKITVVNKRALMSNDNSNSEDSSSDDSGEDSDSGEEETDEDVMETEEKEVVKIGEPADKNQQQSSQSK